MVAFLLGGGAAQAAERVEVLGNVAPDPAVVQVAATGIEPASGWVRGCPGHVAPEAALTVGMLAPYAPLRVHAAGEGLAGVVVAGPDGVHHCAAVDDAGLAVLPIGRALDGDYAIWPSTAQPGQAVAATVLLALRDLYPDEIAWHLGGGAAALGTEGPPAAGVAALAGDDPEAVIEFAVALPATAEGRIVPPGCSGAIDPRRADAVVTLPADAPELHFLATAETDTTLVVRDPAGVLHCVDDSFGMHPAVRIDAAMAGEHAVWVGVFGDAPGLVASLSVGRVELLPPDMGTTGGEAGLAVSEPPAWGSIEAPAEGVAEIGFTLAAVPGVVQPLSSCPGMVDPSRPDVMVMLGNDAPALSLRLRAATDTTLVVRAPTGEIACADDTYGRDPALEFPGAVAGAYAVWGGVFSDTEPADVALEVRQSPLPASDDGQAGGLALGLGEPPAAGVIELPDTGAAMLGVTVNPVELAMGAGPGCAGAIDPSRPDAVLRVPEGAEAAWLRASAPADATLLVVGPDGAVTCNDDAVGSDPVIALEAPLPGDHAVWVGIFAAGSDTVEATLQVARDPAEIGAQGVVPGDAMAMPNPFAGRNLTSATEVLRIAMEEQGLSERLAYGRLEEQGPHGFTLHDVVLTDPDPTAPQLRIGRVRVADLDLAGLEANGEPGTFLIEADQIAYADLAGGMAALGLPPVPEFAGEPMMGLTVALQAPGGDMTRRSAVARLTLDGLFGLGFEAALRWPEGDGPLDPDAVLTEAIEAEIRDLGFLAALLGVQAEAMGIGVDELKVMMLDGLAEAVQPAPPGSRAARLVEVVGEALAASDRPGAIRLRLATTEPTGLDALLEELATGADEDGRLEFDLSHTPL